MPNFNGRGAPGLMQGPKGLADMLAATLRGATAQGLGIGGDVEGLVRMGVNAMGGDVNSQSALPNTEDVKKWLPPMTPISDTTEKSWKPMQELGQFMPAPTVLGLPGKAAQIVKGLRGPIQTAPAVDMGRRAALKIGGAGAVGAALSPGIVSELLRAGVPKAAEGVVAKAAGGAAIKVASKFTPEAVAAALKYTPMLNSLEDVLTHAHLSPETLAAAEKHFGSIEKMKNADAWMEHWDEGGWPDQMAKGFDEKAAFEAFKKDALRAGVDPIQIPERFHEGSLPYLLGDKEGLEAKLLEKHYPRSSYSQEYLDAERAHNAARGVSPEELHRIMTEMPPGKVPEYLAKQGVTANHLAYNYLPIRGPMSGYVDSPLEHINSSLATDMLQVGPRTPKEYEGLGWERGSAKGYGDDFGKIAKQYGDYPTYADQMNIEDQVMRARGHRK